jgi:hypothetical protein
LVAPPTGTELRGRMALAEPELVGPPDPVTFGILGPYAETSADSAPMKPASSPKAAPR